MGSELVTSVFPQAQAIQAAASAHIAEHVAFLYRSKIEQELGTHLPDPDEPLPEDIELRLSRLVAPAAAQLTGKAAQQAQAEQNAQKQQDPIIQMEQEKLRIQDDKVKSEDKAKQTKLSNDLKIALERIQLERDRLGLQAEKQDTEAMLEGGKIIADVSKAQMNADAKADQIQSAEELEGYRMGLDLVARILQGLNSGTGQ